MLKFAFAIESRVLRSRELDIHCNIPLNFIFTVLLLDSIKGFYLHFHFNEGRLEIIVYVLIGQKNTFTDLLQSNVIKKKYFKKS